MGSGDGASSCLEIGHGNKRCVHSPACGRCLVISDDWQDEISKDTSTHGSIFVPIYISSDKTTVSVATGQNDFHPVYMSVGNVHNLTDVRTLAGLSFLLFYPFREVSTIQNSRTGSMMQLYSRKPKGRD